MLNSIRSLIFSGVISKQQAISGEFYLGISGLQLPVPKYLYPEEHKDSSRLTYYATFFNSIEINSTFYKLPMLKTVQKWASSVPSGFCFTFKLWKEITHVKDLAFKEEDVERFFKAVSLAPNYRGCILIQFPPSFGVYHFRQVSSLIDCINDCKEAFGWRIAVEFRNRSWYTEDVFEFLEGKKISLVVQDIPKSATPAISHVGENMYVRFHGPTGNYRDSYSESFLYEYASYVNDWLKEGKNVFVYFNNTMGDAFKNAVMLKRFVSDLNF
jgi:uncharacterized protein YecE (DUF72 family)